MAELLNPLKRRLVLSASELADMTGWDDSVIEDYLNILADLEEYATAINNLIVNNKQFYMVETDANPPALPEEADISEPATIRARRSDGRYEDYVYEP